MTMAEHEGELIRPTRLRPGDVLDFEDGPLTVSRWVQIMGQVIVTVEGSDQPLRFSPEDRVWVR